MPASTKGEPPFRFVNRDDSDSGPDDFNLRPEGGSSHGSRVVFRSSGACVHCKSLKVRCEFNPGEKTCQRCQAGNYQCLARSRKKRKPAPTHEDLQEKSLSQDLQIQTLLLEFDRLKTDKKIRDWMARAQSDSTSEGRASDTSDLDSRMFDHNAERPRRNLASTSAELAVTTFFPQGQGLKLLSPPDIIKYCALYPEEILELFSIFFERVNPFFSILDPELHTAKKLIWTSPFLFTVICAIASRYYTARPKLYHVAKDFARDAAGKALIDGSKNVDVCQAYLLMAVYPVPKKKWAEDRSWLLMGVAIRMAIELELNQPPPAMCDERECLNRTRTWLNCFCVDGSHAIQFGKMPMLRLDDYLARHSRDWYKSSSMNIAYDIHLCAYVDMIVLMAEWRKAIGEGNLHQRFQEGFDVVSVAIQFDERLSREMNFWIQRYAEETNYNAPPICTYRGNTTQMITAYLRLVVLSLGFQYAVKTGLSRDSYIVKKSMDAARTVIRIMTERLCPTGNLRYAMEANFLYVAFAAAFLINLLRPKFLPLLDESQHHEIVIIVQQLIEMLGSKAVALDGRHTPALYSRFLSSLLAKHNPHPELPTGGNTNSPTEDVKFFPQYSEERQQTPPNVYSWPDTLRVQLDDTPHTNIVPGDFSSGMIYQQSGEADMDFSLTHFVRTVSQDLPQPNYGIMMQPSTEPASLGNWDFREGLNHLVGTNGQSTTWPPSSQYLNPWPSSTKY